jgi:metal-sulfur cluster biosynthetic enzyme
MSETSAPDDERIFDLEEAMRDVVDPELGINVVDLG